MFLIQVQFYKLLHCLTNTPHTPLFLHGSCLSTNLHCLVLVLAHVYPQLSVQALWFPDLALDLLFGLREHSFLSFPGCISTWSFGLAVLGDWLLVLSFFSLSGWTRPSYIHLSQVFHLWLLNNFRSKPPFWMGIIKHDIPLLTQNIWHIAYLHDNSAAGGIGCMGNVGSWLRRRCKNAGECRVPLRLITLVKIFNGLYCFHRQLGT